MSDRETAEPSFKPNRYFLELIVGAGFTRRKSRQIYNSLLTHIANALAAGEVVQLKGFGNFQKRATKSRAAFGHAATDQTSQRVRFRSSDALNLLIAQPRASSLVTP